MTDPYVYVDSNTQLLDVNVVDGQLAYIIIGSTDDQRAAICAYTGLGTIPGMRSEGVDWSGLYKRDVDITQIDNTIREDIQKYTRQAGLTDGQYAPVYAMSGEFKIGVVKV